MKLTAVVNGVYWIVPLLTEHRTQVRLRHQQASDDAEEYLQGFFKYTLLSKIAATHCSGQVVTVLVSQPQNPRRVGGDFGNRRRS